jgi:hypothetical protein
VLATVRDRKVIWESSFRDINAVEGNDLQDSLQSDQSAEENGS